MLKQEKNAQDQATITARDVIEAANRIADAVIRTPLQISDRLSALTGATVYLKREDLQTVRSYKIRGAMNFMLQLTEDERARGVVCASAGNHAQGFARACNKLGINGRIFVPRTTPRQKLERIKHFGGPWVDLQVAGSTYDDASSLAHDFADSTGALLVSAFDDRRTIAGQGTVVREIHEQLAAAGHPAANTPGVADDASTDPDVLIAPVGGGGVLAGIVAYAAEHMPHTRVIGAEPAGAASMIAALSAGTPVTLDTIDSFVDGAAVRRAGELTFEMIRGHDIEVRPVPEGRVATEMLSLYQVEGIIAEPAGALASAALGPAGSAMPIQVHPGETVVCLISGGNNDISRYSEVLERSLVHEGLKHYFIVNFPQEPGALRRFLNDVLGPDDDIAMFEYVKRNDRETGPAFVGVTLGSAGDLPGLLDRMEMSPLQIERVRENSPLFRMFV